MLNEMYRSIQSAIDGAEQELKELALSLHQHPELAFHEFFACESLTGILERYGYQIQKGTAGLETAFTAELKGSEGGKDRIFRQAGPRYQAGGGN